jgi:hypothetical protein
MFVYALPVSSAAVALSSLDRLSTSETKPKRFAYIIQLTPTTCISLQDIIYILKSLFKHLFNSFYTVKIHLLSLRSAKMQL